MDSIIVVDGIQLTMVATTKVKTIPTFMNELEVRNLKEQREMFDAARTWHQS